MIVALPRKAGELEYPASDGEPMAETDLHRDEMADLIAMLKSRYRDQETVYVAGNLFIYYEEGEVASRFAPDVFVVFGVGNHLRRVYKLWEEGVVPSVVIEVSSRGTRFEDSGNKKALCAFLGVEEYLLYDPQGEYLDPPLQGFSLWGGEYQRMTPLSDGSLLSRHLGLKLSLENGLLVLRDEETGERTLRPAEMAHAREAAVREREAAVRERDAAMCERDAAMREQLREKDRADAAENELRRLRKELERIEKL